MKRLVILLFIFILAAVIRLWQLVDYPSGFHIDEVTLGYNSFLILNTGRDENGNFLPLYSQSFGLDRALGNFLLIAGSIKLLGLNELAVRLPFAIFGLLTIIVFYKLSLELFDNKKFTLISTFLITISPWHIDLVRASSEASVSLFLILLSQLILLKAIKKNKNFIYYFLSYFVLFISIFFYHSALGFIALSILAINIMYLLTLKNAQVKRRITLTTFILFIALITFFIIGKGGAARLNQVGFYQDPGVKNEQNKMFFEEGPDNTVQARLFHNKIIIYTRAFIKNYSEYFSPEFLLLNAGLPPRYTPPSMGLIYIIEFAFLFFGTFKILSSKMTNFHSILILLFLSPVVAALTYEYTPNVQRAFFMLAYLVIIIAYGFYSFMVTQKRMLITVSVVILVSLNMIYYLHQYFIHLPVHNPFSRNDGAKELVSQINELKNNYSKIIITTDPESPYHFFLFYSALDSHKYQRLYASNRNPGTGWMYEGNIFFSSHECPSKSDADSDKNTLLVDGSTCGFGKEEMIKYRLKKEILRKDKSVAYRLLEPKE